MDCLESSAQLISDSRLSCFLVPGASSAVPPQPAVIKIVAEKAIASGSLISFYVAQIRNPSRVQQISTITLSVRRRCRDDGFMCAMMRSTTFFITKVATGVEQASQSVPTHASNSATATGFVSDAGQTHTFQLYVSAPVTTSDYILIRYGKDNHELPATCAVAGSAFCQSYPRAKYILLQSPTAQTTADVQTLTVSGMDNGRYRYGDAFYVEYWSQSQARIIQQWVVSAISYSQILGAAMSFQPMYAYSRASPAFGYYIKDNYNYLNISISQIWASGHVRQLWVQRPAEISFMAATDACNASLVLPPAARKPYSLRLTCKIYSSYVRIQIPETLAYDPLYAGYTVQLFVKVYISKYVTATATTSKWKTYALGKNTSSCDLNYLIAYAEGSHAIDQALVTPDLSLLEFNTLSFYDRKARIGDQVEFYMLLKPKTPVDTGKDPDQFVNRMVFRVPEEFSYPAIKAFDSCQLIGSISDRADECALNRVNRQTYVSVVPPSTYRNEIKIIRLADSDPTQVFRAPMLPGGHYNLTISLFDNYGLLDESNTVYISDLLGPSLDKNFIQITPGLDAETQTLFSLQFKNAQTVNAEQVTIPPGYDYELLTIYSRIVIKFDNKNGYLNDLGTQQQNNTLLACVAPQGLTTHHTKKLTCRLRVGTSTADPPQIIVEGYDEIPYGTVVQLLVAKLKTLPAGQTAKIYIGVQYTYKAYGGFSAMYYEPNQETTISAQLAPLVYATVTGNTLTVSGSNKVLGTSTYNFQVVALSVPVTTADYFVLEFPPGILSDSIDYSAVQCQVVVGSDPAQSCQQILFFSLARLIYVRPAGNVAASSAVQLVLSGVPNPPYQQSAQYAISLRTFTARQYSSLYLFSMTKVYESCTSFARAYTLYDTNIGGQNNVTLFLYFRLGHTVPATGAVVLRFPASYNDNLYQLNASCELATAAAFRGLYCKIGEKGQVNLVLNGDSLDPATTYLLRVYNLNTPNADTSTMSFQIASYYHENVYLGQMICAMPVPFPVVQVIPLFYCTMAVKTQYANTRAPSLYTFSFTCNEIIRESTDLLIALPHEFQATNAPAEQLINEQNKQTIQCASLESTTLALQTCSLYTDTSQQLLLHAKLRYIQSQKVFTLQAELVNPAQENSDYAFAAQFKKSGVLYAQTAAGSATDANKVKVVANAGMPSFTLASLSVRLANVPKNAGERSTYIFSVPPMSAGQYPQAISQVNIYFPKQYNQFTPKTFAWEIGQEIACGLYATLNNDQTQFTYKEILSFIAAKPTTLSQANRYVALYCRITGERLVTIYNAHLLQNVSMEHYWFNWVLRNVNNPSTYLPETFRILYLSQATIVWQ